MKLIKQSIALSVQLFLIFNIFAISIYGEGTPQLAPNGSITINGNQTNDAAALHINNNQFNNFASYDNTDVNSRLHIHITDPSEECIYLGFNFAHLNNTSQSPTRQNFEYRILDPNGNIVFGPIPVLFSSPQISDWQEAMNGPMQLNGAGGYNANEVSSAELMSGSWTGPGDYYIEFQNLSSNDPFLIDYWDITVVNCSGATPEEKSGRVWSYNWALFAINDFGFPNRPFNGAFFVCAPDPVDVDAAFITKIDFNGSGFRPAAFNVAFNSFGTTNTGNIAEDRKSFENRNVTIPEYAIFLNDPIDICQTAQGGQIDIMGISSCDISNYCIKFISTRAGQIDLLLDFDGQDNVFTPGSADVMITGNVNASEVGQELCLDWDGLNGLGERVSDTMAEVPITLSFAQGIYHFPIYDAELMTQGFNISAVRPTGPDPLLFYDDRNISVASGTGEPAVQLMGCALPCHGWTNYTDPGAIGFGNLNTINSWWFSQQFQSQSVFLLPSVLTCEISGSNQICEGDTISLTAIELGSTVDSLSSVVITRDWKFDGSVITKDTTAISVSMAGEYEYYVEWINTTGDTCFSSCSYDIEELKISASQIDTSLFFGDSLVVNGISYSQAGDYIQVLTAANGCDSIITIIVSVVDPIYTCEIIGESTICFGDTTALEVITTLIPDDATALPLQSIEWSGPGLSANVLGQSIEVTRQGTYVAVVNWLSSSGDNRFTDCSFDLKLNPRFATAIDTLITEGDVLDINGLLITEPGQFEQIFVSQNGCDSIVIINVISQNAVVFYDFDDCRSTDYNNFQADYPNTVLCGDFKASNVYRVDPQTNAHSCTPGVNGEVAICISSLDNCSYEPNHPKSLIFEVEVNPSPDSVINITSLDFFERAPEEFQWIVGTRGLNNYPMFYGLRVLKNNVEIFRQTDNPTTTNWTREIFNFVGLSAFRIDEASLLKFELLPYCLIGNDSDVTAWDIDEMSIQANCGLESNNRSAIEGQVTTLNGEYFSEAVVQIYEEGSTDYFGSTLTDSEGYYAFDAANKKSYEIKANYNKGHLEGVSTMDLLAIQRHILGIESFVSPYQFVAADADNSSSVSAIDILELRRLLLGIYDELPGNESWRFLDSRQELDLASVWNFSEVLEISEMSVDVIKQNFRAVKVGDVNNDFVMSTRKSNSLYEEISIESEDYLLKEGVQNIVELRINNNSNIDGIQLAFELNKVEISSINARSEKGEIDVMIHEKDEVLYISGLSAYESGMSAKIEIVIISDQEQMLSEAIKLYNSGFENAVYTSSEGLVKNLSLDIISMDNTNNLTDLLIGSIPNPFVEQTKLQYYLTSKKLVQINLYTVSGKLIYSKQIEGEKGMNAFNINSNILGENKGILIAEMRSDVNLNSIKILRY